MIQGYAVQRGEKFFVGFFSKKRKPVIRSTRLIQDAAIFPFRATAESVAKKLGEGWYPVRCYIAEGDESFEWILGLRKGERVHEID